MVQCTVFLYTKTAFGRDQNKRNQVLVSFDVVSLFTNIPLELVLEIVKNRWSDIKKHTDVAFRDFMDMLSFSITDCNYFTFLGQMYKQKDGLPMGSPLAPVLACLVMDKLLIDVGTSIRGNAKILAKYVDDLLLIIDKHHINEVLEVFNGFHPSIKFTHEVEVERSIAYLDLKLAREADRITFDWFYKPINSGRLLNYVSHHPFHLKLNVAKSLFRRVLSLSDRKHHHKNMVIVEELLRKNNYPPALVQKWKVEMIHAMFSKNSDRNSLNSDRVDEIGESEKALFHVGITYVQGLSESVQRQLAPRNEKVSVAHRNSNSLRGMYNSVKEKVPKRNRSDVVYKINCAGGDASCDLSYVGTTGRMLKDRIQEHARDLGKKKRNSALVDHALDENHFFDFQNTEILCQEPNYRKRMIKESCYIFQEDTVNYRTDTSNINKLYYNILNNTKSGKNRMV